MNKPPIQRQTNRGVLIFGSSLVYFYGTHLIVSTLSKKYLPYVVDCETSFNPYTICRIAQRFRLNPKDALKRIKVARAFNPYQTLAIMDNLPARRDGVIFFYGPLSLLEDKDFSVSERAVLFQRILKLTNKILSRGQWCVFLQDTFSEGITRMIANFQGMMGLVVRVEGYENFKILKNDLGIKAIESMEVKRWAGQFCPTPLLWRRNYAG